MKNIFKGYIATVLVSFLALSAFAQNDAKSILDRVSKTYSSYKTIKADFALAGENQTEGSGYNEKGRVYLEPSSKKYKIETGDQAYISDGKTQWAVMKDIGEVQIANVDPNDQSISPSNIFNFYKSGYRTESRGSETVGGQALHIIELTPLDESQNVSKIQMRINQSTNLIYDATISDKNGNEYTYRLSNIETNKTFSPGIFSFYKHNYPGLEIVDLR